MIDFSKLPHPTFSNEIPGLQLAWDSTSLGYLKTCPRKYRLSLLEGWRKKGGALPLEFGILYHSVLEEYDHAKAAGATHEEAVRDAVKFAMLQSHTLKDSDCTKRNRFTLVRAVVWYLEHFKDDPAKTIILDNGKPAVELSFRLDIPLTSPDGEPYLLCGHLDRVVEFSGATYVLDRKTTAGQISDKYFQQYSPDNQMSLYTLATRVVLPKSAKGVIIDAVQLAVGFARYTRGIVNRTPSQLDEWLEDTMYWIRLAEGFARDGHWPMNDMSCSMYGGCPFQEICSSTPEIRERKLASDFEKKFWNPLDSRERKD